MNRCRIADGAKLRGNNGCRDGGPGTGVGEEIRQRVTEIAFDP